MDEAQDPFFVVGCARSGTTLMAVLLDRHSRLSIPPETWILNDAAGLERSAASGPEALFEAWWLRQRTQDLGLDRAEAWARFQAGPATPRALMTAGLGLYAERHGKARWGEKSPVHLKCLPRLFEWFPGAKVVVVQRDGRDVAASMLKMEWGRNLWDHAAEWRQSVRQAQEGLRRWPGSVLLLRYEDLLERPQEELGRVMRFLGEDFEPGQLDPAVTSSVVRERERGWKSNSDKELDPARAFAWRRSLAPDGLALANARLAPELEQEGYPESAVAGPAWRRVRWALQRRLWDGLGRPRALRMRQLLGRLGLGF